MPGGHRILVVDTDVAAIEALQRALARHTLHVTPVVAEAVEQIRADTVDAVLVSQSLPDCGLLLTEVALRQPSAARILLAPPDGLAEARAALSREQIHRLVLKPLRVPELEDLVVAAIREVRLARENADLADALRSTHARLERIVEERTRELREAIRTLSHQAVRDGLTGLYNHRFLQEALSKALATGRRNGSPVALLFIDVDHFKAYNDALGHPAGDRLLMALARLLASPEEAGQEASATRASDIAARYGGEEFVILLPNTDRPGALVFAERLRRRIETHPFPHADVQPGGRLTVSIGVAAFPQDASEPTGLIDAADRALYSAKREGRNCVRAARPPGQEQSAPW